MKKNLRIVSAAAAALLAVAPVAATAIATPATTSVAHAASTVLKSNGEFDALDPVTVTDPSAKANTITEKEVQDQVNQLLNFNSGVVKVTNFSLGSKTYDEKGNATVTAKFNLELRNGSFDENVPGALKDAGFGTAVSYKGSTYVGNSKHQMQYFTMKKTFNKFANSADPVEKGYFAYENNDGQLVWANDGDVVRAYVDALRQNANMFKGLHKDTDTLKLRHVKSVVENTLGASSKKINWTSVWANSESVVAQLRKQGFTVETTTDRNDANATFVPGKKAFYITVVANNGDHVTVWFQNDHAADTTTPVLLYRHSVARMANGNTVTDFGEWHRLVNNQNGYVRPLMVEQSDNGTFQPSQYFAAWNNESQQALIGNVSFSDSNVNLQTPGMYHITVTATNAAGKTATAKDVPVIVYARNGKLMTVIANGDVYATGADGKMVKANTLNYEHVVNPGNQLRVYDTKTVDNVLYYRVISPTTDAWVKASDLQNGVVNTPAQETTKTVTIMHISTIYDKNGKATHEPALRAYDTYSVVSTPVNLKDEKGNDAGKFYKLAGKDQYIKVGNVDGTSRSLKHNSYVYKSTGKRANKKTLKKGSSVTTYGKSFMIAGHQMYRIGKNQYVKKANF